MRKSIVYLWVTLLCLSFSTSIETIKAYSTERIRVNVGFKGEPDPLLIEAYNGEIIYDFTGFIPVITCYLAQDAIDVLKQHPDIEYVLVDGEVRMTGEVLPWGVQRIRANLVWDRDGDLVVDEGANAGANVTVAVLDSGIDYDHPDLEDNVIGGKSCVPYTSDYMDDNGHGTHVAGTIAAVDNDIGVIGVAPRVWLYGVKVVRSGGVGLVSELVAGIKWSILQDADIVSMSLAHPDDDPTLYQAIVDANNVGILLVASAGDVSYYGNVITYPAKYEEVIAVGSVNQSNLRDERFSPTGPELELVAPGVDIYSTYWDDTYATDSGTSFAVPHVSGAAALIFASQIPYLYDENDNGEWENYEVREKLRDTAIFWHETLRTWLQKP